MCQKERQGRPSKWQEDCLCPGRTGGQGQATSCEGVEGGGGFGGNFCATEIVNVVSAVKAERAEHVRDREGGALAHHSGRAEAERGRDVEVEKTIVAETEVVVVAGIDAKLSVGAAEVFLEEVTPGAFIADNGLKGIGTREAKGK